jgi:hypothetical protein
MISFSPQRRQDAKKTKGKRQKACFFAPFASSRLCVNSRVLAPWRLFTDFERNYRANLEENANIYRRNSN